MTIITINTIIYTFYKNKERVWIVDKFTIQMTRLRGKGSQSEIPLHHETHIA